MTEKSTIYFRDNCGPVSSVTELARWRLILLTLGGVVCVVSVASLHFF
jgi:hypothetical protein